jgi:hypothetical protein
MITDQDIKKLKKTFVTKKDIEKLTKTFVTTFATKDELHVQTERIDDLVYEVGDLKVNVAELSERMDTRFNALENKIDKVLVSVDFLVQESAAGAVHLARHDRQINTLALHTGATLPD